MIKKFFTVLVFILLTATAVSAQWENQGAFPDTSWSGSTHGIAVDPDGKVWVSMYYHEVPWIQGEDTSYTSGIFVYNPDGTEADFSPINTVATGGGFIVDTLNGACRGMTTDENGNIVYVQSGPSKAIKINYQTGGGMAVALLPELGTSPTSPAVSADGTVFVGPVVGGGTNAIAMYDTDLNYLGNAVVGPPNISRIINVTPDGNTIYWHAFTGYQTVVYQRADEFSSFDSVATIFNGMSIESAAFNPADGLLYVSNDQRSDSLIYTEAGQTIVADSLVWYSYDTETGEMNPAFHFVAKVPDAADRYPRGLGFTADGNTAYIGTFSAVQDRIQKVVRTGVGVKEVDGAVPSEYSLSQNYPNPFNPTTKISFSIPVSEQVTIKVYDVLGKEVATLLNEVKSAGTYEVDFNASNLSSGLYVYTISSGKFMQSRKMMLLK